MRRVVLACALVVVIAFPVFEALARDTSVQSVEALHLQWRLTELLRPPPEVVSTDDVLDTRLQIAYSANKVGDAPVWLRAYNGGLVGPTLRVRPGDLMLVEMNNDLPGTVDSREMSGMKHHVKLPGRIPMTGTQQTHEARDPGWNEPHAFNVTNLHTHGLWVSPAGNSDNVLISIYPGQSFHNEVKIPIDHPPGTHWYHPHRHGSVAMQVSSGMGGMIVIEGGLDEVPQIKAAQEQILVLQQIAYDPDDCQHDGQDVRPDEQRELGAGCVESYTNMPPGHWPFLNPNDPLNAKPRFTTVNGQVQPTVLMQPGQVQRWRLLHAGIRESIELAVVPADANGRLPDPIRRDDLRSLHVVAEDGIAYGFREEFRQFGLDPGNRVDVLVQLKRGRYFLVDLPEEMDDSLHFVEESLKTLAFIDVDGPEMKMSLPSNADLSGLAPYPHIENREVKNGGCQKMQFDLVIKPRMENPQPPDNRYSQDYLNNTAACRKANEDVNDGKIDNSCFFVNGKAFNEERAPRRVKLRQAPMYANPRDPGATADEWQLSSLFVNHPFHIHVNPFEVQNPPHHEGHKHPDGHRSVWRDTWLVKQADTNDKGEFIRARTRYRRYIGAYVLHCHILDHEDQGMMEEVEVMPLPPEQQERYRCER